MNETPPICPTCSQPATRAFGPDEGWECRNEACPEFGQPLRDVEPVPSTPPSPDVPTRVPGEREG